MEGLFQGACLTSGSQLLCLWKSSVSLPAPALPGGGDQCRGTKPDLGLYTRQALLGASHHPAKTFPELHCGPGLFQPNPPSFPYLLLRCGDSMAVSGLPPLTPTPSPPHPCGRCPSKSLAHIIPSCCLLLAQRTDTQRTEQALPLRILRVGVSEVVPGRINKRVHRVCLSLGGSLAPKK